MKLNICMLIIAWLLTGFASNTTAPAATLPAGAQWVKLDTAPYKGKQDDIFFLDPDHGWYVNGGGKIYETKDGGATWKELFSKPGTYFRTIAFVDEKNGLVGNVGTDYFPGVTDTVPLYSTDDGGKKWKPVWLPGKPVKGLCAIDIVRTQYINAGQLDQRVVVHAGGRVGGPAWLLRSLNGGVAWETIDMNPSGAMILDACFFDESNGIVCSATDANVERSHALILGTNDGGVTWTKRYESTRPYETTWKAWFPSRNVGFVTVQSYDPDTTVTHRVVAKTTDGGLTWNEIALTDDFKVREFGVGFASEQIGWVGSTTTGFQTVDGGTTWTRVELGRAVNKIRIVPAKEGFVAYAVGVNVYKFDARPR